MKKKNKYKFGRIGIIAEKLEKADIPVKLIEKIMEGGDQIRPGSKMVDKACWLKKCMDRMDENLDPVTRYKIREECACSTTGFRLKKIREISRKYPDWDDFFRELDRSHLFGEKVEKKGNKVYFNFGLERCVCTVKASPEPVSMTYCHCCKGHITKLLEAALGKRYPAEVLSSACSGTGKCRFAVYIE